MTARLCAASRDGSRCGAFVLSDAPLDLCELHFLLAREWADRETGASDLLPSPCVACGSRLGVHYPSGWMCAICEWRVGETPSFDSTEAGEPPTRIDVVYYLRFDDRIKIGTSGNPRVRFGRLRHDEVLAFERGDRVLEQRRHAHFADYRIPHTEWFEMNDALRDHVRSISAGVPDPWALYARWRSEALALRG